MMQEIKVYYFYRFKVLEARNGLKNHPPLLLKIAPDLTDDDKVDIKDVVMSDEVIFD